MAIDIGPVAAELMAGHAMAGHQRQADASANVTEQTRLRDIHAAGLLAAKAVQMLNTSGLGAEVLAMRGTANQPGAPVEVAK